MLVYKCSRCGAVFYSYNGESMVYGQRCARKYKFILTPATAGRLAGSCPKCRRDLSSIQISPEKVHINGGGNTGGYAFTPARPGPEPYHSTARCECGGELVYDSVANILVCSKCGLVAEDRFSAPDLSRGGEYRYSGGYTYRTHDHGVGSTMPVTQSARLYRASVESMATNKRLSSFLGLVNDICQLVGAPVSIAETAAEIAWSFYDAWLKNHVVRSKTLRLYALACVYIAFRKHSVPVLMRDFAEKAGVDVRSLWRGLREVLELLGDKVLLGSLVDYVYKFAGDLGVHPDVTSLACKMLSSIATNGKSPRTLVTGALYVASTLLDKKIRLGDIREKCGVAAVASGVRDIVKQLDIVVLV